TKHKALIKNIYKSKPTILSLTQNMFFTLMQRPNDSSIIDIAIADDHPLVINGLKNILPAYPHIRLVGTYANGKELMAGLAFLQPHVLLLDIQLPGQAGDELALIILEK